MKMYAVEPKGLIVKRVEIRLNASLHIYHTSHSRAQYNTRVMTIRTALCQTVRHASNATHTCQATKLK